LGIVLILQQQTLSSRPNTFVIAGLDPAISLEKARYCRP